MINNKLSKRFPSDNADTDEKYFRTNIWGYVQNQSEQNFREFLIQVMKDKPKRTIATIIDSDGRKTDIPADINYLSFKNKKWQLHDDFYSWASDVKNQLQKLFKS